MPGLQDLTLQDIQEAHSVEPKQDQLEVQLRVDEADQLMETRGGEDMQNNQRTGGEEALSMRKISNILLTVERLKEELPDYETCRQRSDEIIFGLDKLFRYYTEKHREEVNKRQQTLITAFFRPNVHHADQAGEEEEVIWMTWLQLCHQ